MIHVTDTHPLVWLFEDNRRLSAAARRVYDDPGTRIVVPSIVLAEIRFLAVCRRITADAAAILTHTTTAANYWIHPLDEAVVRSMPTSLSIHDAIIVGTALVYRDDLGEEVALITEDAEITQSGLVPIVW